MNTYLNIRTPSFFLSFFTISFTVAFAAPALATEFLECTKVPEKFADRSSCKALRPEYREPLAVTWQALAKDLPALTGRVSSVIVTSEVGTSMLTEPDLDSRTGEVRSFRFLIAPRTMAMARDFASMLRWKESRFLGSEDSSLAPEFDVHIEESAYPTLYFTLAHELGHVAWYDFGVDRLRCTTPLLAETPLVKAFAFFERYLQEHPEAKPQDARCAFTSSSFRSHSWLSDLRFTQAGKIDDRRLPEQDFAELRKICFYDCKTAPTWTAESARRLYRQLFDGTLFTTVYSAAVKPQEDFAELFALRYIARDSRNRFRLQVQSEATYDILAKTNEPRLGSKSRFVDGIIVESARRQ